MANRERGTAMIELMPVSILLMALVGLILTTAYLIFGKSWIQYQSEQALYCVAQNNSPANCQLELQSSLQQFLPWGESEVRLHTLSDHWSVEVKWHIAAWDFQYDKELSPQLILQPKALRW